MKESVDSYENMVRESFCYDLQDQSSYEWNLVRSLYENNYLNSSKTIDKIPKKIHQVWLGSQFPDKFKRYADTWQELNPTWEYKLWGDGDVEGLNLKKIDLFNSATNFGQKSDVLRCEVLRQYGGLYIDTDFECLKSFDDLLYLDFFSGFAYDREMILYNGLIACIPNHPIMISCVNNPQQVHVGADGMKIMQTTGAYYFTKCFLENTTKETENIVIFPPPFFYPFPNNMRFTNTAYNYIKEYSYAIHHWKTSWL